MLNDAIDAFNRICDQPDKAKRLTDDLEIIREYLSDQCIRVINEANGMGHLNREMDVVNRLKEKGL